MSNLYAVHDWSPDWGALIRDAGMTAWAVISESIGDDPNDRSGHDYSALAAFGVTPIVRLNYSHHGQGTIPLPHRYDAFAQRCANFVSASPGCRHWVIANETNWSVERPGGVAITPRQYANCFDKCQRAIKYRSAHHHVIVAAVAPYNVETGPWLDYWREMLLAIAGDSGADGLALHFYSRGTDPASIHSDTKMDAPFGHLYNGFRAYRDLLAMVPDDLRHLPAYATETNQMQPWAETNSGWVQAAYAEINEWNADPSHQPIKCLALYRWETYDQFGIRGKQGVIDDFRGAIGRGYQSPPVNNGTNAVSEQVTTHLPTTPHDAPATGEPSGPQLPKRQWDERLTQRGVTVETPAVKPGKKFWRVVKAQWFDEQQAGGRHHIYVEALTTDGRLVADEPFDVRWPSGGATESTKAGRGFDAGNFPMSPSLTEFSVAMGDGVPSETVKGIGMGADGNPGVHTSTLVTFQLTTMPQAQQPAPDPIIAPGPTPPQSATFYVAVRDGANLRAAPSVDAAKLTAAAYGQSLTVISATPNRDWLQVVWDGQTGWVLAALLSVEPPPPAPAPGGPTPPVPPSTPVGDDWARAYPIVLEIEGGYSTDRRDKGNWTGGAVGVGELKGTKYGISAASYPHLDIASLTREQALEIYRRDYWVASGANQMPWPLSLVHFDTYVQNKNAAKRFLSESGGNVMLYLAKRLDWYTRIDDWHVWSAGWARRVAKMMTEASKA